MLKPLGGERIKEPPHRIFTPGKKYSNGHKTLTTAEARAMTELLAQEAAKREHFHVIKGIMTKPRNPLAGDETPRTENGNVVLNPNAHGTVANGAPLFPAGQAERIVPPKKLTTGQIGVPDGKYEILGNKGADILGASAQPVDLFKRAQEDAFRKGLVRAETEALTECKMRATAARKAKQLEAQVARMKLQITAKESEVMFLKTQSMAGTGSTSK